jgi:hypothetical protein
MTGNKRPRALIIVLLAMVTASCGLATRQSASSFARADLKARAEEANVEMTEVQVHEYQAYDLSPGDRANGIQANVRLTLRYACRCPGDEEWDTCTDHFKFLKVQGNWEYDSAYPISHMINCSGEPDCGLGGCLPTLEPIPTWTPGN